MVIRYASDTNNSHQLPLAPPNALPEAYDPKNPPLSDRPYKPYAKDSALHEPAYEPYDGI